MFTELEGGALSDRAICMQTMNLIIAGNETTRNLIGNCLYTLATSPALYSDLRSDRRLGPIVVEESLRHDSPIQILARAVLADTDIGGVHLHEGGRVVFGLASANRDESRYEQPGEFRTDRAPRDHLALEPARMSAPARRLHGSRRSPCSTPSVTRSMSSGWSMTSRRYQTRCSGRSGSARCRFG